MKINKNGFSLIELLITVSIIAILSAIALGIYTASLKQGRDSKRQSDLRAIQSALEQYNSDMGFYPTQNTVDPVGLDALLAQLNPPAFTSSTGNPTPPSISKTYLNSLPKDPTDMLRYQYVASPANCDNTSGSKCISYCLYANLENPGPLKPAVCTDTNYSFAVSPP